MDLPVDASLGTYWDVSWCALSLFIGQVVLSMYKSSTMPAICGSEDHQDQRREIMFSTRPQAIFTALQINGEAIVQD
ncbi:hypothetical protein ACHAP8_000010 [Fusarium lateritium]